MEIRSLLPTDFYAGYLNLVSQLSDTINKTVTQEEFTTQLKKIEQQDGHVYVITENDQLLASGTLLVEQKFIHQLGAVGHIEDIVVNKEHRGRGLAQKITKFLVEKAFEAGCYKVILDCHEKYLSLYQQCGFTQKQLQMSIYNTF